MSCTNSTTCVTCVDTNLLRLPASACACPATYYDVFVAGNTSTYYCCANFKCATCSSTNASVCTACKGTNRVMSACACPSGTFDQLNATNASTYTLVNCTTCPTYCATCTSLTSCQTCLGVTTGAAARTTPLCACPAGYFQNGTNVNCSRKSLRRDTRGGKEE